MDCSLPGSSCPWILQAKASWSGLPYSRGSSCISYVSVLAGRLSLAPPGKPCPSRLLHLCFSFLRSCAESSHSSSQALSRLTSGSSLMGPSHLSIEVPMMLHSPSHTGQVVTQHWVFFAYSFLLSVLFPITVGVQPFYNLSGGPYKCSIICQPLAPCNYFKFKWLK